MKLIVKLAAIGSDCVQDILMFFGSDYVVILAGVGKSCLLLRFSDGSFTTSFITTIG